jgi:hypothetical protein
MGVTYADCAADYSADYSELARTRRTPEELIETVPELDVVVLAVSILSFAKVRHADGATDGASDGASDSASDGHRWLLMATDADCATDCATDCALIAPLMAN